MLKIQVSWSLCLLTRSDSTIYLMKCYLCRWVLLILFWLRKKEINSREGALLILTGGYFMWKWKGITVIRKTDWQSDRAHYVTYFRHHLMCFFFSNLNPSYEPKGVSWQPLTVWRGKITTRRGSETWRAHNTQRFHESERSRAAVDKAPDPVTWVKAQVPFWSNVTFLSTTLLYRFHDALTEAQLGKGR